MNVNYFGKRSEGDEPLKVEAKSSNLSNPEIDSYPASDQVSEYPDSESLSESDAVEDLRTDRFNIYLNLDIDYDLAKYGGVKYFAVDRLDKVLDSSLRIPAGCKSGQVFRIVQGGNPGLGGELPGDLVIRIDVDEPIHAPDVCAEISIPFEAAQKKHTARINFQVEGENKSVTFSIPGSVKSNSVVVVRGEGQRGIGDCLNGNLRVRILVADPIPAEDLHGYVIVSFWKSLKMLFRSSSTLKVYDVKSNEYVRDFENLTARHLPEEEWQFEGAGRPGQGDLPASDLYLTPHYSQWAYRAKSVASIFVAIILGFGVLAQQSLTWTGPNAFYSNWLTEDVQSLPASSTRNPNIGTQITIASWAPKGFQEGSADKNVAFKLFEPSDYTCEDSIAASCLKVQVITKIACAELRGSVMFYTEDLSKSFASRIVQQNFPELRIQSVLFTPASKVVYPKWDYLDLKCVAP
jgi:DnaJ-class molecular chaperone